MSFLGIGPLELVFILIIMVLVLGPKNMVINARKLGVMLRKVVKSPLWATIMNTSREIREIPTKIIREAGIEEDLKNIKSPTDSLKNIGNISVPIDPANSKKQTSSPEKKTEPISEETKEIVANESSQLAEEPEESKIEVDSSESKPQSVDETS